VLVLGELQLAKATALGSLQTTDWKRLLWWKWCCSACKVVQ